MAFDYTKTGDNQTNLTGHICFARGTWTAGTDTEGEIVTGLSEILFASVSMDEAVASEAPAWAANVDKSGVNKNGSIGILAIADAANNTGQWFAFGYI